MNVSTDILRTGRRSLGIRGIHFGNRCSGTAKVNIKWALVQALRLYTGPTVHKGSRGIALLFFDHGTRRRWVVSVTPRPLFTPEKDPVPILQETEWAPGPVWTGAEFDSVRMVPYTIRTVHTTHAAAPKTTTYPKARCRKPYAATQHLMLLMIGVCTRNMSS